MKFWVSSTTCDLKNSSVLIIKKCRSQAATEITLALVGTELANCIGRLHYHLSSFQNSLFKIS